MIAALDPLAGDSTGRQRRQPMGAAVSPSRQPAALRPGQAPGLAQQPHLDRLFADLRARRHDVPSAGQRRGGVVEHRPGNGSHPAIVPDGAVRVGLTAGLSCACNRRIWAATPADIVEDIGRLEDLAARDGLLLVLGDDCVVWPAFNAGSPAR
jgi:hypothetical protein